MKAATKTLLAAVQACGLDESLIRFSRFPLVNRFVLSSCWQKNTEADWRELHESWKLKFAKAGISLSGKKVLEIGAGSWGLGREFLADGVAHWSATDVRVGKALDLGGCLETFPLDVAVFDPSLEGRFDAVVSSAAMEHVRRADVPIAIENMVRYVKTGGIMLHEIDLRDHINVSSPHHFLKYSEREWNALTEGTIFYTNRLRAPDFMREFAKCGLQTLLLEEEKAPLPLNLKIADEFSAYAPEELETTRITCILKKNG